MRTFMILAAALAASPALAQPASRAAPPAAAETATDPARVALARVTVDGVWPLGTYERMMKGTMDQMINAMTDSMFDMRIGDVVPAGMTAKADPELAKKTMREVMEKEDPHFQERMRITNQVMMQEMIPLMNRIEPAIREGLAHVYARKFTAAQLSEINGFLATPAGRVFGTESMMAMMDPEIVSQLTKFAPELVKEMPRIMEKVKAATAHLPLPSPHSSEPSH